MQGWAQGRHGLGTVPNLMTNQKLATAKRFDWFGVSWLRRGAVSPVASRIMLRNPRAFDSAFPTRVCPDLNPEELVWSHAKRTGTARCPLQKGESLRERIEDRLEKLHRLPKFFRSFFQAPFVAYSIATAESE